jgi:hypothetical protein
VLAAELEPNEENYVVNANVQVQLNPTVQEVLNNGIPLYFVIDFELIRPRWYWLDKRMLQRRKEFRLSYNALTQQYRVIAASLSQDFPSLDQALLAMTHLRNWPVADRGALEKSVTYQAGLRLRLDLSQLPKPFQVSARASSEWDLSSEWYWFPVQL